MAPLSGSPRVPATALMEPRVAPKDRPTALVVPPMPIASLESRVESALSVSISEVVNIRELLRALVSNVLDRREVRRVVATSCRNEVAASWVLVRVALDRLNAACRLASVLRIAVTAESISLRLVIIPPRASPAVRLRLLFVRETVVVMAPSIAAMNAEPTRLLTAAVLALATPGVTVPPPLPMQHPTPGRPEALANELIRSVSKLPGSITVVQQLLARMFRMVRLLPSINC